MKQLHELTDSDAGTGGVGHWIPADVYADLILDGVVCYGQLAGVITAMEYDFTAGGGDTIQVRYVSPRTHSCASAGQECECLSVTSTTFGTYSIPVWAYGDYDELCGFSLWEASGPVKDQVLNEMAKRLAMCRDARIWDILTGSSEGFTPNVNIYSAVSCGDGALETSCCTFTYDLYNSIVSVMKHMQGDGYDPDYVILHPNVAKFFYYKDAAGYFNTPLVKFDTNGNLTNISTLKVIESCNAADCSTTGSAVMAVVIDSKRACGEVWGKKPSFHEFYEAKCDRYEEVVWMYWGALRLDPLAISHISNPA